jgi:hypothetical protein
LTAKREEYLPQLEISFFWAGFSLFLPLCSSRQEIGGILKIARPGKNARSFYGRTCLLLLALLRPAGAPSSTIPLLHNLRILLTLEVL